MRFARFSALFAVAVLGLTSCADSVVEPALDPSEVPGTAEARVDLQTVTEVDGFRFISPVSTPGRRVGTFNPNLAPRIEVYEVAGLGGATVGAPVAALPFSSASVEDDAYQFNWDTDGPETTPLDPDRFYELRVIIGETVTGTIGLDPRTGGRGRAARGAFGFQIGRTIPVTFWTTLDDPLCVGESFVTECITGEVVDQSGGFVTLDDEGPRLAVNILPNSLPDGVSEVTVVLERIDADLFFQETGNECIPLFDAPQFGECLSITTVPELGLNALVNPATVSICVDVSDFGLTTQQEGTLNMIRYNEQRDEYEALADAIGDCGTQVAGLIPVPENGLLRYAATAINKVAEFVLPQPLHAMREIRLGGLTSSFSRFRFALPGEMVPTAGDNTVIQQNGPNIVDAEVTVLDYEGFPVADATVHFTTGDGTLDVADVTTGANGVASVQWTVDTSTPGTKTLIASALGLVETAAPDEQSNTGLIVVEDIEFTATVVGPPASIAPSPATPLAGVVGEPAGDISITVTDAEGTPVADAPVTWTGDGSVSGGETTDATGTATGTWTLGTSAGGNTMTATVGDISVTFTASAAPGEATDVVSSGAGGTVLVETTLTDLSVTVTDAFGNPRPNEPVIWGTGSGSIDGAPLTDASGVATASWTLGSSDGVQIATATVGGLSVIFNVIAEAPCPDGRGVATIDGTFGGGEWTCANSTVFAANTSSGVTPAEVWWMNDDQNIYFAIRVQEPASDVFKVARIELDNDADGVAEAGDDALGYFTDVGNVLGDGYLKCVGDPCTLQAIGDDVYDGSVFAGDDGTWKVIEFSHPLSGQAGQDIDVGPGDTFGFWVELEFYTPVPGTTTTQFPGHRVYLPFTVANF